MPHTLRSVGIQERSAALTTAAWPGTTPSGASRVSEEVFLRVVASMAADSMEAAVDTGNSMPGDKLTYGRKFMNNENESLERVQRFWYLWFPGTVGIATVAMLALWAQLSFAQPVAQRTFSSPQQASQALYRAVENQD